MFTVVFKHDKTLLTDGRVFADEVKANEYATSSRLMREYTCVLPINSLAGLR